MANQCQNCEQLQPPILDIRGDNCISLREEKKLSNYHIHHIKSHLTDRKLISSKSVSYVVISFITNEKA